ncbi:MAG: hypothetical protein ABI623_11480 [bacterium]
MDMLEIKGFLPDTAKNAEDRSAIDLRGAIEAMIDGKGKLQTFEVSSGVAFVTIQGESAKAAVMAELQRETGVTVTQSSALARQLEKNKKRQEKSVKAKKRFADANAKNNSVT